MSHIIDKNKPHVGGAWLNNDPNAYDEKVFDEIINTLGIKTMISVGCGQGYDIKYFHDKGIACMGIDGSETTRDIAVCDKNRIVIHDYTEGEWSTISRLCDLCLCIEFVEHMEEKYIDNFISTFKCAKYVAMTHAVPGQDGYHHVNCQDTPYWLDVMNKNGFVLLDAFSSGLRGMTKALHLQKNLMVFRNTNA